MQGILKISFKQNSIIMKTWTKIIIGLFVLGLLAALAVYIFVYNKPHTNYEKAKPDYKLKAEVLYNEFITDQASAEQKYNAKVIQITGILHMVETSDEMVFAIFAFGDGMFGPEGIRCQMLDNHVEQLKLIEPGENITVKGFCSGYTGTDVIMEHCSIIQ